MHYQNGIPPDKEDTAYTSTSETVGKSVSCPNPNPATHQKTSGALRLENDPEDTKVSRHMVRTPFVNKTSGHRLSSVRILA